MNDLSLEFLQEEWTSLKNEVTRLVTEINAIEKLSVGASGAVYAWLVVNAGSLGDYKYAAWFIPVLFSVLGAIRVYSIYSHINVAAEYLLRIERKLLKSNDLKYGWEKHLASHKKKIALSSVIFWGVFNCLCFGVAIGRLDYFNAV